MKIVTDEELIAMGMQVLEARRKGGRTTLKKYGAEHFANLGRKSAEKKKILKIGSSKLGY